MDSNSLLSYPGLAQKCTNIHLVLPPEINQCNMAIVGEALGVEEDANEQYFVGKAGQLLDKLLRDIGLIRSICHVTNVIKIRPPDNKLDRLHELNITIDDFLPYLKEELTIVKPKIILALGATAMRALTDKTEITKWRGSVVDSTLIPNTPIMITLHPSYLQRGNMKLYIFVRHDIKRFAEMGFTFRPTKAVEFEELLDPTLTQIMDYLNEINTTSTATCFDIETVARDKITCIGFSKNENSGMCIPFRYSGFKNRWAKHEQIMILKWIKEVYNNDKLTKVAQNAHYDMHYLLPLIGFPREPLFDTLQAHALIHPDAPHDLGFLVSNYTDMAFHKDEFKDWAEKDVPKDAILWGYNIKDVIGTHRVYQRLKKDLIELDLYDFFTGYIMPFRRVLFEMEWRGINVDIEKRDKLRRQIEEHDLPDVLWCINELASHNINPNSSQQVGTYLASLGLPIPRTEKGNYTVKEDKLEEFYARFPQHRRIMEVIICARKMKAKDLGTYLTAPLSKDGRLRTSFGIAKTGRLLSRANHLAEGTNLQNQPKRLRVIYIPDEGHVFLTPDLEQAEALAIVYYMKAEKLKQRMNSGEKIHAVVAEWIDSKKISELTPERYRDIKSTVYGSNYRMGVNKFATILGKTVAEAKVLRDRYYTAVPELPAYHQWVEDEINNNRKLVNAHGRIRPFTTTIDKDVLYSGYAQLPQSDVADTINKGILGLWLIKPVDILLLLQVHDEVVISLPLNKVDWFKIYIKAHLSTLREMEINGEILVIPVDIGKPKLNWYGRG